MRRTSPTAPAPNGPVTNEQPLAHLHVCGAPHDGRLVAALVEAAGADLGLGAEQSGHLAVAAGAVARAVHLRGFDDPATAALDVEVLRRGHQVVVRVDDLGLPFDYESPDDRDGAVLRDALAEGWVDAVHHTWRGRDGNRTELVVAVDPADDLRPDAAEHRLSDDVQPFPDDLATTARVATADDVEGICRLTWRTYGATYQHDEYYLPDRLAALLASGSQVSFVVAADGTDEIIGHSAVLVDEPGAVVVEAGRAMVDPRARGHHLMRSVHGLRDEWFAAHGVLALSGAAVTAHTRSQLDRPASNVQLAFLPPVEFRDIGGPASSLRVAVLGGFIPCAPIPPQSVHLPARDAAMISRLHELFDLDRTTRPTDDGPPDRETSTLSLAARGDLGHAVISTGAVGRDLGAAVRDRLASVRGAAIAVTYCDLRLDDPGVSWGADVLATAGFVFSGLLPLEGGGVDLVRYQHLGDTEVDPGAIAVRDDRARELLAYVLAQWASLDDDGSRT